VVERPASVVKELVENALDAGAQRIRVEIRDGGRGLVAVTDDGCGMSQADARLALERHATSKITTGDDLTRIATFGFRGEALPAIASVSRLRLRTRARGAATGIELLVEGGKLLHEREAAGPEGTRVEVAELFEHVPARRKFLKTAATEWTHVADWLARVALALPGIHFDVQREGRAASSWPAVTDPLDRVAAVLTEREAEALVPVSAGEGALSVEGFVSRPDAHRPTTAGVHLFVLRRPVRDRLLRHALLDAYRDVLPRGRHPTALLFLDLPPHAVDVNVHPAKWEVRFADPGAVHRLVLRAVREALASRRWLLTRHASTSLRGPSASLEGAAPPTDFAASGAEPSVAGRVAPAHGPAAWPAPAGAGASDWLFAGRVRGPGGEGAVGEGPSEAPARLRFGELRPIGQLLATYLLVEATDGLLLVDQHAAHERVLFERLRAGFRAGRVARQPLLVPETVEIDAAGAARLAAAADSLERIGFELEPFGEGAVAVRAVPALLAGRDPCALVCGLADELERSAPGREPEALDRLFASLACHGARRAGDRLDAREQQALLDALDEIPWAPTCPHGRPVAIPVSRGEIERRFGR
jgi:DNA mismatch repair protein MutL